MSGMMLHHESAVGDTFVLKFVIDYIDKCGLPTTSNNMRHVTVMHHDPFVRLCFIDIATGDIINAWYAGYEPGDEPNDYVSTENYIKRILYDYAEGTPWNYLACVMFPTGHDGITERYISKKDTRLTATIGEALACH
jgi:hypothetical protein